MKSAVNSLVGFPSRCGVRRGRVSQSATLPWRLVPSHQHAVGIAATAEPFHGRLSDYVSWSDQQPCRWSGSCRFFHALESSRKPALLISSFASSRGGGGSGYQTMNRRQVQSRHSGSKKRHNWKRHELVDLVKGLVSLIKGEDIVLSLNDNVKVPTRETLNVNFCFDVLEACMEVCKQTRDINVAHQAHRLLTAMEEILDETYKSGERGQSNRALVPTTSFFDVVLQSYAVCGGGREAALAAQSILERMVDRCRDWMEAKTNLPPPPEPSVKTFNIVVNAWAKSRQREAGERAESVVQMMNVWNAECRQLTDETRPYEFRGATPDIRTLVPLVDAWSRSRHPKATQQATSILMAAIEESKRNKNIELNPVLFHVVLGTLARSRAGRTAAERAEEILSIMEECADSSGRQLLPGTKAYAMVLEAWMRCEQAEKNGNAARRAEYLLRSMIETYRKDRALYIKPNKMCFTTCISAWSRAYNHKDAPERAQALLTLLTELYKETQDPAFRPDVELYNSVIAAWTRAMNRRDSMVRARECLQSLRDYAEPNLVSFNTILDGMAKRGLGDEARRLVDWLEEVAQESPYLQPDIITYNSALSAFARDETCARPWEQTLALLQKMEEMAASSERNNINPDQVSYTIALGAWLRSKRLGLGIEDALQAQELVRRSLQNHNELGWNCRPDSHVFSSMIQVCARVKGTPEERERALDIALAAMEECAGGDYGDASYVAYASCMKAVNRLCMDEVRRRELLMELFDECKRAGYVSRQIVIAMKIGVWKENVPPMQPEWSRKVPKHG